MVLRIVGLRSSLAITLLPFAVLWLIIIVIGLFWTLVRLLRERDVDWDLDPDERLWVVVLPCVVVDVDH